MRTKTQTHDDPFARLEEAAHKQKAEEDAAKNVSIARAKLIIGDKDNPKGRAAYCFFATLALRFAGDKTRMDWDIPTAATDGRFLHINPDWFNSLPLQQAKGVVAHEVMHCALAHPSRRGAREPKRWNIACDLAINPIVRESGLQLPPGGLFPGEGQYRKLPVGKSAEEYYSLLPDDPPQGQDGDGEGGDGQGQDPGGCGGVKDPGDGSQAACQQCQADWEVATAQAHQVAKQRGQLPASIDQLVEEMLAPKRCYEDVLREFVNTHARNDYSWSPPNRRFIHQGIYLPGLRSEELGELVATLDESASITEQMLLDFGCRLQGILEVFSCKLTILHHDTRVQHVEEWSPSDGPLVLRRRCNGGTSHVDVFDWINKNVERPTCVLCLTDLETAYPSQAPDYPVLWAVAEGVSPQKPPFGTVLEIK